MRVVHIALGGCLSAPPVAYGQTEDTGGHIAYVLGAARAQAARNDISAVEIITRGFHDPVLGARFAQPSENLAPGLTIRRLFTGNHAYLEKSDLDAEVPDLTQQFLRKLSLEDRPDIIHAHFADAALLAAAAKREFGIPWVYTPHSLGLGKRVSTRQNRALDRRIQRERFAIKASDAIIVSSRDEAEAQIAAYDEAAAGKTFRVNPGVSLPQSAGPARARTLLEPFFRDAEKPLILAIARPVRKKNLHGLIAAYAEDAALRERANLAIVAGLRTSMGDLEGEAGDVVAELFDLVDRHGLWGHVALPKRHDVADVASLYNLAARSGVFVNPAYHEPFGLTLVEAAQSGVPVVATRHGGPTDIVKVLGYGELVDPHHPKSISAACHRILDDPLRAVAAAQARRAAHGSFNWATWAEQVSGVYAGLGRHHAAPRRVFRVFASDIDGTLTGCRTGASDVAEWRRAHPEILFVVATGRPIGEARKILCDWDLPAPDAFITSVGSEIWRWGNGSTLVPCSDYASRIAGGWSPTAVEEVADRCHLLRQDAYEQRAYKRSFVGTAEDAQRLARGLSKARVRANVIHSHGRLIDVLPERAGKAAAVAFLAEGYGLSLQNCIAAGDSGNDADLLSACRWPIVPSNGLPELAGLPAHTFRSALPSGRGVVDGLSRLSPRLVAVAAE